MKLDAFSKAKRSVRVGGARVAYYEAGEGDPVVLLHGCPFSSFVWRNVIPRLSRRYRCLAPDLLGLGDTETSPTADWSLRAQLRMVLGFLDALGVARAHVVGHDHGGALAQLLAAEHPDRVDRLVLANCEAYDNWPSAEERPFVTVTQIPILGDVVLWLWSLRPLFRLTLLEAWAVADSKTLTAELLDGCIRANLSSARRRIKTKRFLAGQFDPANNRTTMELLPGLRRFDHPTLLIWGQDDPHFGPEWGQRLARDIPGTVRLELLPETGHLLMEERPDRFAELVDEFLLDQAVLSGRDRMTALATRTIIPLRELRREDRPVVGTKAANLGELAAAGFPVPDGFVVIGDPDGSRDAVRQAAQVLGGGPFAVRSSGLAEDLPDASFAGQYETILHVQGDEALIESIRRCRDSARNDRVLRYQAAHTDMANGQIAVLVQRMLAPDASGVAFTANPVTGERDEIVVTAAHGLGERIVSGEAIGDEWLVRGADATRRRSVEQAISAEQAHAVAQLARKVDVLFGSPQDIEWSVVRGSVYLLQTRPMTALPDPVEWTPPMPGYWMRNFRLGEWLPEPMTPLFRDWLLERIEAGYVFGMQETTGAALPFRHAAINGWYYTAPPRFPPVALFQAIAQSRGRIIPFLLNVLIRVATRPDVADRTALRRLTQVYREALLPRYRRLVQDGEHRVEDATVAELEHLVDEVGSVAGECLWSLAVLGGSAWKMEGCLAKFLRRHVGSGFEGSVQVLLRGLPGVEIGTPAYAVQSVDWYRVTAGELKLGRDSTVSADRREQLIAKRREAEVACRVALADTPALLSRFEVLLEVAQRYAALREEQARSFTLGWPLLRRCALRLGDALRDVGDIEHTEDVFFLTRAELHSGKQHHDTVNDRRSEWERQRRRLAPLTIGKTPKIIEGMLLGTVEAVRTGGQPAPGAIVGHPASPGRATGPVRIVHGPEDFDRFQAGEVLVAQATAPAWTPLFADAVAVVTDGGTLAAHASLVAREYGIPAVVGTGDATVRLSDGQNVTVDGGAGTVLVASQ